MTRMFLEDDDNLSDDVFNDAAPQDETEEPEPLENSDEDDDFDENWDADFEPPDGEWYAETLEIKKAGGRRTAPISPTRTKRKTRKKNDLRYVRRLFRGGSGSRASCEGGEAASQSIAERVARPPNVAESGAILFGFACRAEQLPRR